MPGEKQACSWWLAVLLPARCTNAEQSGAVEVDGASGGLLTASAAPRQILQGVPNNYETDLILPIVACAARLAGLEYAAATPKQRAALKVSFLYPAA